MTTAAAPRALLTMLLVVAVLAVPTLPLAQQRTKSARVGVLHGLSMNTRGDLVAEFRDALREHGYVEGQTLAFEYRFADGREQQLPHLAAELVNAKVDVIAAATTAAMLAAKRATSNIPIVMIGAGDPVEVGLVSSLARPGGNVTGVSYLLPDLEQKRFQILKETVPAAARIAHLGNPTAPTYRLSLRGAESAARELGLTLVTLSARQPNDFEALFQRARKEGAGAVVIQTHPLFDSHMERVADLALKNRLPAIYGFRTFPQAGGLISYGANQVDVYRKAARYVARILDGAKPADLPVEQPTKFDLIINLRTAKALGITIPPSVLIQAAEVLQ